jgi:hypothetical protein
MRQFLHLKMFSSVTIIGSASDIMRKTIVNSRNHTTETDGFLSLDFATFFSIETSGIEMDG